MKDNPATIRPLTSIRGLAALWVYLYHNGNLIPDESAFREFVMHGYYGVDIFFILSGFIISYVHEDDFRSRADMRNNGGRFLLLRLVRIYPLHFLTLVLVAIFHPFNAFEQAGPDVWDFVKNLLLVHALDLQKGIHYNVVSWSISVEWLAYLCFPLLARGLAAKVMQGSGALLALLGLLFSMWFAYLALDGGGIGSMAMDMTSVPRGFLDFAIGAVLYNLCRRDVVTGLPWHWILWAVPVGFAVIFGLQARRVQVDETLVIILSALLIYGLANLKGIWNGVMSCGPLLYLGTISYSFYMLHWFYIMEAWNHREVLFHDYGMLNETFAAKTLVLFGLSALSFHLFENPSRHLGRWLVTGEKGGFHLRSWLWLLSATVVVLLAVNFYFVMKGAGNCEIRLLWGQYLKISSDTWSRDCVLGMP
jgi:peptidoglycan/LPS O-acetylase OafA/YrhL